MKCIVSGNELKEVMCDAVNLLCDTVSSTLGPTGNNVLINNSEVTPFITNDGVTIASNIGSDNKKIDTVLEIVKEASLKTNELVGDGTTTTLVLLQSIFNLGIDEINKGMNKIVLKNELLNCMREVVDEIHKIKKAPSKDDLLHIAMTSTNDLEIATITTDVFLEVGSKYSIKLEESGSELTYSINKKGYNIPIRNISSMYFSKKKNIGLKDVEVLVLKGYLNSLESISDVVNDALLYDKNLIIFVEGMSDSIRNEILVYYFNHKNIFIVELEEYASHRDKQEDDISTLSGSTIKNIEYENVYCKDLGTINNAVISSEEVILVGNNKMSSDLIKNLKEEIKVCNNEYEKDFINGRISKLENGITTIYVGGTTKSEKREKIMRYEDAISSLESAKNGIVTGEGITYLIVSRNIDSSGVGSCIIKKSLEKPFEKVMDNLGLNYKEVKNIIIDNNYKFIYDYEVNDYIPINKSHIIDSVDVIICAFKNALSIAAMLLSTSSLVINLEEKEELNIM